MSTSTQALVTTLRTRLLSFSPMSGSTVGSSLSNRLYVVQAPASVVYPYGVMRYLNRLQTEGLRGMRETGDLEVQLFHRPRSQQATLEAIADVMDQALLDWQDVASGIRFTRQRLRDTLPAAPDPMDREVVQVRMLYPVVHWPRYVLRYFS